MAVKYQQSDAVLMDHKRSWQNALSMRACPPDQVLLGEKTLMLQKHLRTCFMCQANVSSDAEATTWEWPRLAAADHQAPLEPGDVRRIRANLAGWGPKSRYYNPPLVLLLERVDEQVFQVAQIYPGDDFMGPYDLSLDGYGYVQPWNTYSMGCDDLGPRLAAHPEILPSLRARVHQDFTNLPTGYYHDFFYALEIELGSFFSQLSLARLLTAKAAQGGVLVNLEDHRKAFQAFGIDLPQVDKALLPLKVAQIIPFPVARPQAEASTPPLRLAAADTDARLANVVVRHPARLEISSVYYTITACETLPENRLLVAGWLNNTAFVIDEFMAWWQTFDRQATTVRQDLTPDGRFFEAEFEDVTPEMVQNGRLTVIFAGKPA